VPLAVVKSPAGIHPLFGRDGRVDRSARALAASRSALLVQILTALAADPDEAALAALEAIRR
jgi:hypothetical protein